MVTINNNALYSTLSPCASEGGTCFVNTIRKDTLPLVKENRTAHSVSDGPTLEICTTLTYEFFAKFATLAAIYNKWVGVGY